MRRSIRRGWPSTGTALLTTIEVTFYGLPHRRKKGSAVDYLEHRRSSHPQRTSFEQEPRQ